MDHAGVNPTSSASFCQSALLCRGELFAPHLREGVEVVYITTKDLQILRFGRDIQELIEVTEVRVQQGRFIARFLPLN